MTGEKMLKELNNQIQKELYSAYLYLAMAADFENKNRQGFASWLKIQAKEEVNHAMKLYGYITDRGGKVEFKSIEEPPKSWKSPLDAFENAYKHEIFISKSIDELVKLARTENDYATETFLAWFVAEQVEEEVSADEVVQKIKQVGDSANGLYQLDKEMSKRGQT